MHDAYNLPWLIGGDFNEVLEEKEKFGGLLVRNNRIDKFAKCLNHCKLIDLGYQGSHFTWTNKQRHGYTVLERLDRFLANYDWINLYPEATVKHLPRTHSDHCPILISLDPTCLIPNKVFRFETMWASHPQFKQLVHDTWSDDLPLMPTINKFKAVATRWNQTTFGNIFKQKRKILARLAGLQSSVHYPTSIFLQNLEIQLNLEYNNILRVEEEFWQLKSRVIG